MSKSNNHSIYYKIKNQLSESYIFKYKKLENEILIVFFQNLNIRIRSEITKSELKIPEPNPKHKNIRTGSTPLYQNTQKSKIHYPNPNGYPNSHL